MKILKMKQLHYKDIYSLWISTPGMGLNSIDDSYNGIRKYIKRNPNTCFIAKDGNKLIGVILSGHDGRRGYIHHTAVDYAYRNKGVGTALVNAAINALRKEEIHKVAFVVFKNNELGNEFWESLGFSKRDDLIYRNKVISDIELQRIDT
ncbi:MAG: GNAT family N-acetyltransferase [Spirochaetes bacterium GWF1_31_7]|nr:MAG: GNAT family N-acetyltransferase [Spirochaetes bacterium GWE1_32_154]OHD51373.1 MAG: GNAT family N-acetyltransferase [Spirochaetes bacterium GWE2_31_10]OHD53099.1 MAG: GNAT family N-acetyltransferase [Spirochaetes bacterium GWF1_31_7]HBD94481.1 GNAT family N-acetyltransferase [Spirochaetia bacterium]HBI36126.1 GNAT family N-acetyltransferase [Spirochaetia bacterium]